MWHGVCAPAERCQCDGNFGEAEVLDFALPEVEVKAKSVMDVAED